MKEHTVRREGARVLQVVEDGDPDGAPVFSLHGSPGARLLYPPHVADARAKRIRLIGYDRPGYGGSTALRGRSVGDVAGDVAAIADHLGIDRFAVWGHSGGGAPALACAALLPDRVVAASSLAGVAPFRAEGLDALTGMGEANLEDFRLLLNDRVAWEAKVETDAQQMRAATADQIFEMFRSLLSDVDLGVMSPELVDFFLVQGREGLRSGGAGMRDDGLSDVEPWGFELASIRVPVQVWHGRQDRFVPVAHGEWIAARLPQADLHLLPDEGHVSLYVRAIPLVHDWLRSKFGPT